MGMDSGQIHAGSEVVNSDSRKTSLHGAETNRTAGFYVPATAQSGGDSLVTSIQGSQNLAPRVHGEDLRKTNQFALLDNLTGEGVSEGEIVDLALKEMKTQRPLKTPRDDVTEREVGELSSDGDGNAAVLKDRR